MGVIVDHAGSISGAGSEFAFIIRGNLASRIPDTGDLGGAITIFEQLTTDALRILGSDPSATWSLLMWRVQIIHSAVSFR